MKVLYVTNRILNKDLDLRYLSAFADLEDVFFVDSNDNADKYITENLISNQGHLDFIIVDFINVNNDVRDKLVIQLRSSPFTYSRQNFCLCSIPVILFKDWEFIREDYLSPFYDKIVFRTHTEEIKVQYIGNVITTWMQEIGDDLSHLNLDLDLKFDSRKVNWLLDHRGYKLRVLSHDFLRNQRKLDYIWFGSNLKTFDVSINTFYDLLQKSEWSPGYRNEKEIHQCLIQNKRVLLGEFNNQTYYEKHFYLPNCMKYVEPDFTNMPFTHYVQNPEIFEVKLPNQKFVRKDKTIFYRNTTRAINQVALKYSGYFSNPANEAEIEQRIGYNKTQFNYTLLMGRKADKEENLEYVESVLKTKNLKLLTYDELLENFQRLYDRTTRYNLS